MKLQRTPLILLLIALALGGFVYFYEVKGAPQRETAQAESKKLFSFKEEQVRSFTLTTPQQTLTFERATEAQAKSSGSQWTMAAPDKAPANEASVAYLLNLLATESSQRTVTAEAKQQAEYGLDQPAATIVVTLDNQQTHQFVLGKPAFDGNSLYAQTDPAEKSEKLDVHLVSSSFSNAVSRPLSEWKAEKVDAKEDKKPEPDQKNQKP
jgi:hypothetical protein